MKRHAVHLATVMLVLSGCDIKNEVIHSIQAPTSQSRVLNSEARSALARIIDEERKGLPQKFGYNPDFVIWQSHPSYTGSWRDKTVLKIGYQSRASGLNSQYLSALQVTASNALGDRVDATEPFIHGIAFGHALLAQQVIVQASRNNILPRVNAVGYTPETSTLKVVIDDQSAIPALLEAIAVLGIDRQSVKFEINSFVPLGDLLITAAITD